MGPRSNMVAAILLAKSSSYLESSSRSKPAEKLPPNPWNTATYMDSSCSKSSNAACNSSAVWISTQFRFSGRLMPIVMMWNWSNFSTTILVYGDSLELSPSTQIYHHWSFPWIFKLSFRLWAHPKVERLPLIPKTDQSSPKPKIVGSSSTIVDPMSEIHESREVGKEFLRAGQPTNKKR